ncbi:MAG TPA: GYD domain-containing protein [Dehalococcoidia bacterium]|nr:GYD domain-containing protein [Dehalococcoidia bacterium]
MTTYIMFGKFSTGAMKEISTERTSKSAAIVEGCGGKVKALYALLGETDALAIADFPSLEQAMKASVELTKLLGVSFTTSPAITVEEFDKLFE